MAETAHRHRPEWPCNLKHWFHMCASRVVGFDRSWYGVGAPIMQVGLEASMEVGGRSQDGGAVSGEGFQVVGFCLFGCHIT